MHNSQKKSLKMIVSVMMGSVAKSGVICRKTRRLHALAGRKPCHFRFGRSRAQKSRGAQTIPHAFVMTKIPLRASFFLGSGLRM